MIPNNYFLFNQAINTSILQPLRIRTDNGLKHENQLLIFLQALVSIYLHFLSRHPNFMQATTYALLHLLIAQEASVHLKAQNK